MEKKKVLFLIHTLQVGGAEKVLVNLVNNMDKSKFDVTVMTVINTGAFRYELNDDVNYKYIYSLPFFNNKTKRSKNTNDKSGNLYNKTSKIKRILANCYKLFWKYASIKSIYKHHIKEKYDVEVAFLEGVSAKIISHSNNEDSKKICWIHVDLLNECKTEGFFKNYNNEKECYERFDEIIGVSEHVKSQFIKKFNTDENKVKVAYNPIDSDFIEKQSLIPVEDVKKSKFTILSIGRLSKQKGFDRLLNIVKKLNLDGFEFELWIIGVGDEEASLKKFIVDNSLNNVKMLGYKKNPYPYIKMCDLVVCSSRAEGFSTVISESIILEKPIVTTLCSGMIELLGNSEYGIVCDNDEDSLYNSLNLVLSNKEEYNKLCKKIIGRKKIFDLKESIYSVEKILENEK